MFALLLAALAAAPDEQPAVSHVNDAIAWYRRIESQAPLASEPADVLFVEQDRQLARQALGQAVDGARGVAELQPQASSQQTQPLEKRVADAFDAVQRSQADVDALQKQIAAAPPKQRGALEEQLSETRSELALAQARAQALKTMSDFRAHVGGGSAGTLGQLDELERSVPELRAQPQAAAAPQQQARPTQAQGLVALLEEVFALTRKQREIHDVSVATLQLRASNDRLRQPIAAQMKTTLQAADQISSADDQDPVARKQQLDALSAQFKKLSAALLPLGKEVVLLDAVRANLAQWDATNDGRYGQVLRALGVRAGLLAVLIVLVLAASEFWRRATVRLIADPRRRQVSLIVRRVVVTACVSLAILFAMVNELGSLATFAGFITAGLAVALQNVILSVAAYFFLIGKYGIRVGERVQIGTVVGDVLDIGLVRLHVLELGSDGLPTGRVVVFSNSIVFQGPNLFRPLPGTDFAWHEIKLTLSAAADHQLAEQKAVRAVQGVVDEYRDALERQHAQVQDALSVPLHPPKPESRLRLTDSGLEMVVRYPVPLGDAAAVDDKVTRALLEALQREPKLRVAGSQAATLQPS